MLLRILPYLGVYPLRPVELPWERRTEKGLLCCLRPSRAHKRRVVVVAIALVLAGCAAAAPLARFPSATGERVPDSMSVLAKPDGAGPFPAVVMLHTCGGIGGHLQPWMEKLVGEGYIVLRVDSFTPRWQRVVCGSWAVSVDQVAADALAAADHLRKLPFVDAARIAVVGYSYGAMAGLRIASASYVKQQKFPTPMRAVVAFYPYCTVTYQPMAAVQDNFYRDIATPLLLLLGADDTEAPARLCTTHADVLIRFGQPVSYTVFPGATHAFDQDYAPKGYRYDAGAVDQSWRLMREFLAKHLR